MNATAPCIRARPDLVIAIPAAAGRCCRRCEVIEPPGGLPLPGGPI